MHFQAFVILLLTEATISQSTKFAWNCTNSLGFCNNACYAVNAGLAPMTLTYDSNPYERSQRLVAMGSTSGPCNRDSTPHYGYWGDTVAEYPFAITYESASLSILRCVLAAEYQDTQTQLANFFLDQAYMDGDKLEVFLSNYIGAHFCEHPGLLNDGSEFRLSKPTFLNTTPRRIVASFEDATESADSLAPPNKTQEFLDENGELYLSLSSGSIGDQIWSQGKITKVVEKVN